MDSTKKTTTNEITLKICVTCPTNNLPSIPSKMTYKPTFESLSKRPLPIWYNKAKFGIMMHWGVYSVPAYHKSFPGDELKTQNGGEWY